MDSMSLGTPVAPGRSRLATRLVAFTPLWVFLILLVLKGTFWSPLFATPSTVVGVPTGLVGLGLAGLWMLLGVVLVWDARSWATQLLAYFVFTLPATIGLVLFPGILLILQNLDD